MSHISNRRPNHSIFNGLWRCQAIGRLATRANYASLIRSGIGINEIQVVPGRLVVHAAARMTVSMRGGGRADWLGRSDPQRQFLRAGIVFRQRSAAVERRLGRPQPPGSSASVGSIRFFR